MINWNDYMSPPKDDRPLVAVQMDASKPDTFILKPNTHFTPYMLRLSANREDGKCIRCDEIPVSRDVRSWYSYLITGQVQPCGGLEYGVTNLADEHAQSFTVPGDGTNTPAHLGIWVRDHANETLHLEALVIPDTGFWHTFILCVRPRDDQGFDIASLKDVVPNS